MANIYTAVDQLIGNTPLLELINIEKELGLKARLLAKLEYLNPAGSVKDRVAKSMLEDAERSGRLKPGGVILEPTSGNTGIGLACVGAAKGYKVIILMPDNLSKERQTLMTSYGAQLVLTEGAKGMQGAVEKAKELQKQIPDSIIAGQFENPANPAAHYATTGPEIWRDTDGQVDVFVSGIGTGGTVTGVGRYLKEQNPNIQIVGVEPAGSPLLSKGYTGTHNLQGIGANFVPPVLDRCCFDELLLATEEDAYTTGRMLARREGVLTGISSGAAAWAAIQTAKRKESEGKTIVVLLPDTGDRYLSTALFQE